MVLVILILFFLSAFHWISCRFSPILLRRVSPSPASHVCRCEVSLEGQVGLVTGAGTPYGIGRELVLKLGSRGAQKLSTHVI